MTSLTRFQWIENWRGSKTAPVTIQQIYEKFGWTRTRWSFSWLGQKVIDRQNIFQKPVSVFVPHIPTKVLYIYIYIYDSSISRDLDGLESITR